MTPTSLFVTVLAAPAVAVLALVRPSALFAVVLLGAFVASVTRVGLWLLGDQVRGDPGAHTLRIGGGVLAAGAAVATVLLLLGSASVPVLALVAVATALLLRPRAAGGATHAPRPG